MAKFEIKATIVIETDTLENACLLSDSLPQMFLKEIGARNLTANVISSEDQVNEIIE